MPVELFDIKNNRFVNMPDEQIADAVRSGQFALKKGTKLSVLNPEGQPGTIPAEDAFTAFNQGFSVETEAEANERILQGKFGNKPIRSALAGAARGLTFGLSDVALTGTDIVSPFTLRQLEERNRAASLVGEFGGILSTGGTSAAAKGAGIGVRGVTRASAAVERQVTQELLRRGITNKIVGKALPRATGAALVEGPAFATGRLITEDAIGTSELNAENLIAFAGMGSLLGLGFGGAFGLGEVAVPASVSALKNRSASLLPGGTKELALDIARKGLEKFGKIQKPITGRAGGRLFQRDADGITARANVFKSDAEKTQLIKQFTADLNKQTDDITKLIDDKFTKGKIPEIEAALKGVDAAPILNSVRALRDDFQQAVKTAASDKDKFQRAGGVLSDFEKMTKRLDDKLAVWDKKKPKASEVFKELNFIKQQIDAPLFERRGVTLTTQIPTRDLVLNQNNKLRALLSDEGVFGEAGRLQGELNRSFSDWKTAKDAFTKTFTKKDLLGKPGERFVSEKRIKTFVNNLGKEGSEQEAERIFFEFLDRSNDVAVKLDDLVRSSKSTIKASDAKLLTEQVRKQQKEFAEFIADRRDFQELSRNARGAGVNPEELVAAGIGSAIGGLTGFSLVGAAAKAISNPANVVRFVGALEKAARRTEKLTDKSINTFFKAALKRTKAGALSSRLSGVKPASANALIDVTLRRRKPKNRREGFEFWQQDLKSITGNASVMERVLNDAVGDLDRHAPKTALAAKTKLATIFAVLNDKLPRSSLPENVFLTKNQKFVPNDVQLAEFERLLAAVNDPKVLLKDLENGTLDRDVVQAVKSIYPEFYGQFVQKLVDKLATTDEDFLYGDRVQLSLILGVPLDSSLKAEILLPLQQNFVPESEQESPGNVQAINNSGVGALTQTQQIEGKNLT